MEKKVIIRRISHRGEWRYGIEFPMDVMLADIVRNINGALWSNTLKCWHLPGTEEALKDVLTRLKGKADIDISSLVGVEEQKRKSVPPPPDEEESFMAEMVQADKRSPGHPKTIREVSGEPVKGSRFGNVRFSIDENDGKLVIKFLGRYDQSWIDEMRTYGTVDYDKLTRSFQIRWSQLTVDSLADYFADRGVKVEIRKADIPAIKEAREEKGNEIRGKELGGRVIEGLDSLRSYLKEKRYSKNTVDAYMSLIEIFFKYYSMKDPDEITADDITDFFNDYVVFHNYSASYQNQMVSAIKLYYLLNGKGKAGILSIGRPRRSRALPKVFSKEEIKEILNSPRNDKHRLILWIIYSCGLRRSEVINIRLRDIDRKRGILNIREGKGMVDRIVPVSEKVWVKLDSYLESYRPKVYLFEGQTGGRYSSESVYRIFKEALKRTGIKKDVGVHSLRHSYATHLHENGLDIRYIQELLGHRSTRTTEIYTHVSRRNLAAVRSPIEDLDIK